MNVFTSKPRARTGPGLDVNTAIFLATGLLYVLILKGFFNALRQCQALKYTAGLSSAAHKAIGFCFIKKRKEGL